MKKPVVTKVKKPVGRRPKSVAELLKWARDLIEKGWTQGVAARNLVGLPTGFGCRDATSFCAAGALWRYADDVDLEQAASLLRKAAKARSTLVAWNDSPRRTKEQVLAAYDRAIEMAEEMEQ